MTKTKLEELKEKKEAPEWMTPEGFSTLSKGYLLRGETPKGMYKRVSSGSAKTLKKPELADKFFELMWNNWLCLASPVAANTNTNRGLNISCFSFLVPDNMYDISDSMTELAIMSKYGGGVGVHWNHVRPKGSAIGTDGSTSDGVIPFIKVQDSMTIAVSQGATRRGASAAYLPIEHLDIDEFLRIRRPEGDVNRQCLNIHQGVCVSDQWMEEMLAGDTKKRELWKEILKTRVETGEPYLFFSDNVNKQNPEAYKKNGLTVKGSNICCVTGDTLVTTKHGIQKIENLVNKTVEIWDGKNWVFNSSFEQRGIDEVYEIEIADGSKIKANSNHRWFAAKNYQQIRKNKFPETLTKNLSVGMWLESHSAESHGNIKTKGAYLKGFLIGDGTCVENRPLLRLHSTKYVCEQKLISSANECSLEDVNTNCVVDVSFGNETVFENTDAYGKQCLKNMQGLTARKKELINWSSLYKKELPTEIYSWDSNSKLEFLAGIFDSDGTVSKQNSLQFSSKSKKLVEDIQMLLKTFSISSNIDEVNQHETPTHRLTVSTFDCNILSSLLPTQRIKFSDHKSNRKLTGWRRIVKITKLEGQVPVYCPILPSTGKFALANGLMTGNTEIMLHTDEEHSFVCCLSSMNLARWDEWKDTDAVYLATWFLDGIIQEFIDKAKLIKGFERAVRSAEKGRALGIGALGLHTLFQKKMLPLDSLGAFQLNSQIFKHIDKETKKATKDLAKEYGEPEWCKGLGIRNTHRVAVAPTVSNSIISGDVSQGIEPWASNYFAKISAKGTFYNKNKQLEELLEQKGMNTDEVWKSINSEKGSVQHLDFLSDLEKEVFLTAREINQFVIIKLAAQRQKYIDQGQSINLFFPANADGKYIHKVHVEAWKTGVIKSLYYLRSESALSGESASRDHQQVDILNNDNQIMKKKTTYTRSIDECKACEG